jgi:hypothetical protein
MTTTRERRQAFRTIEGWAIGILLSAGAIRECDEHGYMKERTDPVMCLAVKPVGKPDAGNCGETSRKAGCRKSACPV